MFSNGMTQGGLGIQRDGIGMPQGFGRGMPPQSERDRAARSPNAAYNARHAKDMVPALMLPGEFAVPSDKLSPSTLAAIKRDMAAAGINFDDHVAGSKTVPLDPASGLPMFDGGGSTSAGLDGPDPDDFGGRSYGPPPGNFFERAIGGFHERFQKNPGMSIANIFSPVPGLPQAANALVYGLASFFLGGKPGDPATTTIGAQVPNAPGVLGTLSLEDSYGVYNDNGGDGGGVVSPPWIPPGQPYSDAHPASPQAVSPSQPADTVGTGYGGGSDGVIYNSAPTYDQVQNIYRKQLGREGAEQYVSGWVNSGQSLGEVLGSIQDSEEYQARYATRTNAIQGYYQDVLNRRGQAENVDKWNTMGISLADVLAGIQGSQEALNLANAQSPVT